MDPFNQKISLCEGQIGYTFQDQRKCLQALQASGQPLWWQGQIVRLAKNDRLAVLGDAVAKAYLCDLWHATGRPKSSFRHQHRGDLANSEVEDWTTALSKLDNSNLWTTGFERGLDACLLLNHGTTSVSNGQMATAVEAIFAAVYLDGGRNALGRVLTNLNLIHPFLQLQAVTSTSQPPIPCAKNESTLQLQVVSQLIDFLGRDIGAPEFNRTGAFRSGHDEVLSACNAPGIPQPIHQTCPV